MNKYKYIILAISEIFIHCEFVIIEELTVVLFLKLSNRNH